MSTFDQYAQGRDLGFFNESARGSVHKPKAPTEHYMVWRFDREWPPSLMTTYLDILEAAQLWIDKQPGLAPLLSIERPLEVGDDYYVTENYLYWESTSHIVTLDPADDYGPDELKTLQAEFMKASGTVTGERDVLIASIVSRSVLTPNAWTYFTLDDKRFHVVDLPATRAEGEMWLAHAAWHVNPG